MPFPQEGEKKSDFIKRFMDDAEAKSDYPDEKARLGAAYGIYKNRVEDKKPHDKNWRDKPVGGLGVE